MAYYECSGGKSKPINIKAVGSYSIAWGSSCAVVGSVALYVNDNLIGSISGPQATWSGTNQHAGNSATYTYQYNPE